MKQILSTITGNISLTRGQTHYIMMNIIEQKYTTEQIVALLMGLQTKGVTPDEILGFRDALMETRTPVEFEDRNALDIVGTGGDGKNSFNISTCACFVVAGAGYKVAKHGNGSATSVSGASNVLEGHGVRFTNDNGELNRSLNECGFAYMHAPLFANGMKHVAPARKAIQIPTIFNLIGPLVNPSAPQNQMLGVANLKQMRLYSLVYEQIGTNYGIVSSIDGYDEISLTSDFKVKTRQLESVISPEDLGMPRQSQKSIYGGETREEAMRIFDNVLENKATTEQKNVVIANAAYAIKMLDPSKSGEDCIAMARESIESGKALNVLKKFIALNS